MILLVIFIEYKTYENIENYKIKNDLILNNNEQKNNIEEVLNLINLNNGFYKFNNPIYHYVYRPGSISENYKNKLNYLLSPIIKYINQKTKSYFYISDFNKIIEQIDTNKNKKILIDFHIVNTVYFYRNIRLNIEIIILNNGKNNINSIKISNNQNIENNLINSDIDVINKYPKKYSIPCRNNRICVF